MLRGTGPPQTTTSGSGVGGSPAPGLVPDWILFPGWELITVLVVVLAGAYLSKYVVRLLGRPVARRFPRQSVAQTVLRLVQFGVVAFAGLLGARIVGFELGNVVLSVTVFSAVLGIVLAPIVGSVVNGIFLLADQPYEIGDMIELDDGTRGFVDDVNIRYTKIFTLENTFLVIPNGSIRERDVTNYSAEDERTRLSLNVLVTYESDVAAARSIIERAAADVDVVIEGGPDIRIGSARYPARPTVLRSAFGDDGVVLTLRYWAQKPYKIPTVESRVRDRIWDAFHDADVEFAYPHRHLVFDDTSGTLDARVSGQRGPRVGREAIDGDANGDGERETTERVAVERETDATPTETDAADDAEESSTDDA